MRTWHIHQRPIDILIADDEPDLRESLRMVLECEGYSCAQAENGREAVEIAQQSPPRLVLLDLMMPELDGLAAARRLRSDPRTRHVSILCLTARSDPSARRAARQAGCDFVLTKPMPCSELLDVISISLKGERSVVGAAGADC